MVVDFATVQNSIGVSKCDTKPSPSVFVKLSDHVAIVVLRRYI